MAQLLRMPEVAAGGTKAVLASWSVTENATYTAEDNLAEIETDKATVDLNADADGVILKLLVTAGAEVAAGDPIALLGHPGESGGDVSALLTDLGVEASPTPVETAADSEPAGAVDAAAVTDGVAEPAEPEGPAEPAGDDAPGGAGDAGTDAMDGVGHDAVDGAGNGDVARIFSSPLARRLARDAGLTLSELNPGSGPGGRVRRSDVEAAIAQRKTAPTSQPAAPAAAAPTPAAAPTAPASGGSASAAAGYVDEPHSKLRRLIAARLTESKQTVPHFYLNGSARVDKLLELRNELNEDSPTKLSINDLIVKAAAHAHVLIPQMNVIWTPDALRQFERVDISVAVASERGLVTPTLRGVDASAVSSISAQIRDFARRADAGKLKQDELDGGALSVTNLGMFGTEDFGAIINPPQSAILAVGAALKQPIVVDNQIEIGTILRVTLSVDHRAIDGRLAAEWLRTFLRIIERPTRILT